MSKVNIVLFEPEIPQNTGNIMRTCVGFGLKLHLIRPFGFHLTDKNLMRSAVDYYQYVDYECYDDWEDFIEKNPNIKLFYLTRYGHKQITDFDFKSIDEDIYLVFGKESTGIPYDILADNIESCFRIPSTGKIRAFNVSNCVAMVSHEVMRQLDFVGLEKEEPDNLKGHDFLDKWKEGK